MSNHDRSNHDRRIMSENPGVYIAMKSAVIEIIIAKESIVIDYAGLGSRISEYFNSRPRGKSKHLSAGNVQNTASYV